MEPRKIYKISTGFTDNGSPLGATLYWDEFGTYVGQEQINCMDETGEEPALLFFPAQGNEEPVRNALTQEEMDAAIEPPE